MSEEDAVIWYGLAGEQFAAPVLESLYQQGKIMPHTLCFVLIHSCAHFDWNWEIYNSTASVRSALFPKVQNRVNLCAAMFERNPSALTDAIKHANAQGL